MEPENNFILELSTSLEEQVTSFQHICSTIFSRNEFVDCTLCCSDGQLKAHRVILASASNYMHNMLSTTPWPTPCSHPMLFFKTFSLNDMKLALEFIYTGKAKVSRNKLPTLMNIARELGCSSLSKAIEKAIHSFGVEIFRKRIQSHPQPETINKSILTPTHLMPTSSQGTAFASSEPESDLQSPQQRAKENVSLSNNDLHSIDNGRTEDEGTLCSSQEIKLEPGENMMLELDPSSIVTTMDSTILANADQSSAAFPLDVNDETTNAQDVDVKVDHNLNISRELDSNDEGFQIHDDIDIIIGMKDKVSDSDKEISDVNILNNSVHDNGTDLDDDQMQDEDEEEMPITVVDLKSLAETGSEETDAKEIAMSSTGMDNAELPANCPWCFQVFTSLTLLQRHIKTHVGMYKPYSCQYCPASFARSAHLKRHIRTHTGEKPFVCSFCSRAFSRQDKLKTHLEKHLLDQHLQNSKLTTTATAGFPSLSQSTAGLTRPNTAVKASTSVTSTTTSGNSPHKQIMQMQGLSTSANFTQCLPSYQYFINDGSEMWQADRISKGLFGVPGQITISTNISPSTTITPIPSLLVPSNPPPAPPHI